MKNIFKHFMSFILTTALVFNMTLISYADDPVGNLVINEISWAGTEASSSDEWIELYNPTEEDIDLNGWKISDDGDTLYPLDGIIKAKDYFVIEDSASVISNYDYYVKSLSLANSGDYLELLNDQDEVVDSANLPESDWFAGASDVKASMERIDFTVSGELEENWLTAIHSNGSLDREGDEIIGTPNSVNSSFSALDAPSVSFVVNNELEVGQSASFSLTAFDVENFSSFGFEIQYDAQKLRYLGANEGQLLSNNGQISNSFYSALENNQEGKVIIGASQLDAAPVSGGGVLFLLDFEVLELFNDQDIILQINNSSFISEDSFHTPFIYQNLSLENQNQGGGGNNPNPLQLNTAATLGEQYYTVNLVWDEVVNAETYIIYRSNQAGEFVEIARVDEEVFIDTAANANGLVSFVTYQYEVRPLINGQERSSEVIEVSENRVVAGDVDFSQRVDGHDLEYLAKSFAEFVGEDNFDSQSDLNYDGVVDGEDLIIFGQNFGIKF